MRVISSMATLAILVVLAHPSMPSSVENLPSDVPLSMMERLTNEADIEEKEEVLHKSSLGTITGYHELVHGNRSGNSHLFAFRGIPYARPPVGSLRLREPEPLTSWENSHLDARNYGGFCPQYDYSSERVMGQEDCLFLNIFTSKLPGHGKSVSDSKLPVFVFLHGGAYLRGSSSSHGPHYLLTKDIVLVTVNYRIGALGFLSTESFDLPGNYGLLDQEAALVWVQKHISEFGGDPNRVTLGGFSAGAASTHIHALSPRSKGLFHSAILMSGSTLYSWGIQPKPLHFAKIFAENLNCPSLDFSKLKSCLELKTTNEIVYAQAIMHDFEFHPLVFRPVVDVGFRKEPVLPDLPAYLTPHTKMPIMMGQLPNEGLLFAANQILGVEDFTNVTSMYNALSPLLFDLMPYDLESDSQPQLTELALRMYFSSKSKQNVADMFSDLAEMITDHLFLVPQYEAAQQFTHSNSTVYSYLMSYREVDTPTWSLPLYNLLRDKGFPSAVLDSGVSHGDDLIYIFSFPYAMGKFTQQDQQVQDLLITMWTDFIMTGSPQAVPTASLPLWTPVNGNSDDVSYYDISLHPKMIQGTYKRTVINFWKQIVPDILNKSSTKSLRNPINGTSCTTSKHRSNYIEYISTCNNQGEPISLG